MRNAIQSILISLLLHLMLLSLLLFLIPTPSQPVVKPAARLAVVIENHPHEPIQGPARLKNKFARKTRIGARGKLKLSKLGVIWRYGMPPLTTQKITRKTIHAWNPKMDRRFSLLNALYKRIDAHLTYPAELKSARVEGTVQAHLRFSKTGQYLKSESRFESSTSFLRVVVIKAIDKALESPLFKLHHGTPPTEIEAFFIYRTREYDGPSLDDEQNQWIANHTLVFYRSYVRSSLQWEVGPLAGLLPVPMVGLNIGKLYDSIASLFSNKAKIDPLDKYRADPAWNI